MNHKVLPPTISFTLFRCVLILIVTGDLEIANHGQVEPVSPRVTPAPQARGRSDTILSTVSATLGPQGQQTMSSMFFVVQALETIQNSKEGKRKGPLKDSTTKALGMLQ